MRLLTPIPDEFLQANGNKRWKWINVLKDRDLPIEIIQPLHAPLEAKAINELPMTVEKIKVAIYKKSRDRGKYQEYEYIGDR